MGCGVACVAMVAERPYEEVRARVPRYNVAKEGFCDFVLRALLATYGIPTITVGKGDWLTGARLEAVPVEPFAPVHIVCVDTLPNAGAHFVVMLPDSSILDPNREGTQQLSDYCRVHYIVGVYPQKP